MNLEGGLDRRAEAVRDQMRRRVVEKSIGILRRHGRSGEEIRALLERDFRMDGETWDELLNKSAE